MSYIVHIRKNDNGEVRQLKYDAGWDDSISDFIWTEGNWACDCNRAKFFEEAGGIESDTDFPCGDSAYSIMKIELSDGRVLEFSK